MHSRSIKPPLKSGGLIIREWFCWYLFNIGILVRGNEQDNARRACFCYHYDCWQYERSLSPFDGTFARRLRNGTLPGTLKEATLRRGNVFLSMLQSAFGLL
jgi:hypothetical protein